MESIMHDIIQATECNCTRPWVAAIVAPSVALAPAVYIASWPFEQGGAEGADDAEHHEIDEVAEHHNELRAARALL